MRYYVKAYNGQDRQILGNLDGQGVICARYIQRTAHYKMLISGTNRPRWAQIKFWKIVDERDNEVNRIDNPCFGE